VEAALMDGAKGLTLTGQLGDVMKESAQIGLSYVRSHALELGLEPGFEEKAFHVHVPAGAVPKDGPSAGVTMVTALVSLLTGRPVRSSVGMTGEVTLQGRVLPIGGVKQKLLAAHRAALTELGRAPPCPRPGVPVWHSARHRPPAPGSPVRPPARPCFRAGRRWQR